MTRSNKTREPANSQESTTTSTMQHTIDTARSYSGLGHSETYHKYMTIINKFEVVNEISSYIESTANLTQTQLLGMLEVVKALIDLCDNYTSTHGIKWLGVVTRRYEMVEDIRAQAVALHDDLIIKGQRLLQDEDNSTGYTYQTIVKNWDERESGGTLNLVLEDCQHYLNVAKDMQKTKLGQQRYQHVQEIWKNAFTVVKTKYEQIKMYNSTKENLSTLLQLCDGYIEQFRGILLKTRQGGQWIQDVYNIRDTAKQTIVQIETEKYNKIASLNKKPNPTFADLRRLAKLCEEYTKEFGKFRNTVIGKNRFDEVSAIGTKANNHLNAKIAAASATKKIARAHARVADADTMRDFNLSDTALPEGVQEPDWSKNWKHSGRNQREDFITNSIFAISMRNTEKNESEQYEKIKDLYEKVVLEETSSLEYNKDGTNDTLTWLMKLNKLCTAYLAKHKSSKNSEAIYHTLQVERIQGVISELVEDTATALVQKTPTKDAILSYVKVMRAFKTYTINRSEGNLAALLAACKVYVVSHKSNDMQSTAGQNRIERFQPIYENAQETLRNLRESRVKVLAHSAKETGDTPTSSPQGIGAKETVDITAAEPTISGSKKAFTYEDTYNAKFKELKSAELASKPLQTLSIGEVPKELQDETVQSPKVDTTLEIANPVPTEQEPQNEMEEEIREVKPKIEDSSRTSSEENSFDDFEILDDETIKKSVENVTPKPIIPVIPQTSSQPQANKKQGLSYSNSKEKYNHAYPDHVSAKSETVKIDKKVLKTMESNRNNLTEADSISIYYHIMTSCIGYMQTIATDLTDSGSFVTDLYWRTLNLKELCESNPHISAERKEMANHIYAVAKVLYTVFGGGGVTGVLGLLLKPEVKSLYNYFKTSAAKSNGNCIKLGDSEGNKDDAGVNEFFSVDNQKTIDFNTVNTKKINAFLKNKKVSDDDKIARMNSCLLNEAIPLKAKTDILKAYVESTGLSKDTRCNVFDFCCKRQEITMGTKLQIVEEQAKSILNGIGIDAIGRQLDGLVVDILTTEVARYTAEIQTIASEYAVH